MSNIYQESNKYLLAGTALSDLLFGLFLQVCNGKIETLGRESRGMVLVWLWSKEIVNVSSRGGRSDFNSLPFLFSF
jgi:hypothetical protein